MRELSIEEKARAYDRVSKEVKDFFEGRQKMYSDVEQTLEYLFPELKESEDEKIRKDIIFYIKAIANNENISPDSKKECKTWIAWLEKQGDKCLVNFDEAEQEKYDFVSGQYIECRASFNEFKEDNSYWLEYIGDDNYIGRSDNILNQKFHITPRQLFTLFTWQHSPKEDSNVNDETNAPTEYGKYVDECLNEASKHFFSDGEDAYSVADLFYAGVRCGKSWLEKQGEKKPEENKVNIGEISPNWSEEDEHRIKDTVYFLDTAKKHYASTEELDACIDWLKSLKDRVLPQNTWKPSIAQLNALSIVSKGNAPDDIEAIVSLYNDLKKLTE